MIVGVLTVELFLPSTGSLKDKRQIIKSLKDRVRQRFNVAIAEVDEQDLWQKAVVGVACVGNKTPFVHEVLDKVVQLMRATPLVEIVDHRVDLI